MSVYCVQGTVLNTSETLSHVILTIIVIGRWYSNLKIKLSHLPRVKQLLNNRVSIPSRYYTSRKWAQICTFVPQLTPSKESAWSIYKDFHNARCCLSCFIWGTASNIKESKDSELMPHSNVQCFRASVNKTSFFKKKFNTDLVIIPRWKIYSCECWISL